VITCNPTGALARHPAGEERLRKIVLDPRTNDRSLVMTSSFTNLLLAGRALASLDDPRGWERRTGALAALARLLLAEQGEALAQAGGGGFPRAVFLGSGARAGAAREAALKMLEMSAGKVLAMAETFLGLRHGPMSALDRDTLVVAFVSRAPHARGYELDVLGELRAKGLGARTVIVHGGPALPPALASAEVLAVEVGAGLELGDDDRAILDVVVGQWLALFRCLALGLAPDAPSPAGVIDRVVPPFALHGPS
jgi:tagatose-6-phosphate ketose/aldose isomerase